MIELLAVAVALRHHDGPPRPPHVRAEVAAFWDRVADCETGGRWWWGRQFREPSYEGGVGFAHTTWVAWITDAQGPFRARRLMRWWPHAFEAPRLWQIAVAEWGLRVRGGYWGCLH